MSNNLHILGARIIPPVAVSEEDAARGVHERLHVVIEVENVGGVPLHVWSSRRAFDFNPATGVLRLDLAEPAEGQPPGMIKKISDHPRVPSQIIAAPREKATIDVPVPTSVRHLVPPGGVGMAVVEEPIEGVREIKLRIQYADVPFQRIVGESPRELRERLRAHGSVARKTVLITRREKDNGLGQ